MKMLSMKRLRMTKGLKMRMKTVKNMRKTLNFMTMYEQSEDEQCLLEKDDKAFDNYVDHNAPDIDPTADEGEKSDDMAVSDVNNLDSSLCNEFDMPMRKRKRKLPKFDDFRPNTVVNGSSMVQIKSYEEEHTCRTVEHNFHDNSSWLAERYST
ncbi:unnamed protein product [Prunus armeniaca]|uniref:Uncharacterized protein n=1 Tax=Prunus armeniaca TaxID=36596 RepID=A0A6J5Y5N5_PRUAR|nr:unnamed protein product [Prunus armeniaca]CAB4319737.1 unnamed protein product [Prunus armeniaca]